MDRKYRWAGALVLLWGTMGALGALEARLGPTEPPKASFLVIDTGKPRQKPPVWFSHQRHEEKRVACERCHHEYQGKRNIWRQGQPVKKCQACHGLAPQARRPDLKNALHRQCKGCHLQLRQQQRAAGPITCRDCHRRY
ncbi:MAG: hypothetical protein A2Y80_07010 [Deltaproteobacteria bacterium RBG_13_58_19]|nr:MAG: hypothetical protein A2Y80_07010 [Deltaproteobacteria bacterium RBG_13_58_19]